MVAQIDRAYRQTRWTRVPVRLLSYAVFEGRPVTTKGQWVNPVVFAHFRLLERLPQLRPVRAPIYVAGMGRSGTTILGVVLSMHRQVGFLNEPKALWHAFYDDEDVIGSYSMGPARYRLDAGDVSPQTRVAATKLYGAYLFYTRRTRVVDKYPEVVFRVPFVLELFPDARFIFLTRDGWDACTSIDRWSQLHGDERGGEVHDWWGVDGRKWELMKTQLVKPDPELAAIHDLVDRLDDHRLMAAVEWVVTMREGLRVRDRYPNAVMTLRYEDLVLDPEASLRSMFEFCDLPDDDTCLRYAEKVLQPVASRPRFDLPPELAAIFSDTSVRLGYAPD